MFGWFKEKTVTCSLDHFEELKKRIDFLEDRIKKVELKQQLKPSGELKVFEPIKKNIKKKHFLSSDEREQMKDEFLAGFKPSQLSKKYDVHVTTVYNVISEKEIGK